MNDTTQPDERQDYAEALHEWRDLISDQKWAKWFKDAVTSALERAALAPVAVKGERLALLQDTLIRCANIIDVVKQEWAAENCWSEWDQETRSLITKSLQDVNNWSMLEKAGVLPPPKQYIAAAPKPPEQQAGVGPLSSFLSALSVCCHVFDHKCTDPVEKAAWETIKRALTCPDTSQLGQRKDDVGE